VPISQMEPDAIRGAYVLYIGAGAVAAGGIISLFRSLPTIWHGLKGGLSDLRGGQAASANVPRTDQDLSMKVVVGGVLVLIAMIMILPQLHLQFNLLGAILIIAFGFLFVTVSSRLTGEIGSSSNPISGMTVATLLLTCLIFLIVGWSGPSYYVTALSIGGIVCIAASNGGTTSQDLKTGFLVGATPRAQQIGLLIGVVTATVVVGVTIRIIDQPPGTTEHLIGTAKFAAPQATLMATLIRGLLAHNLDWQYVMVGVALAATVELCGVGSLSFAVGAYLPLSTTSPIFVGGVVRAFAERARRKAGVKVSHADAELGPGNLFATGLVAGGAVMGVLIALATAFDAPAKVLKKLTLEHGLVSGLGDGAYQLLGLAFFTVMTGILWRVARQR